MKPPVFDYHRAASVAEAIELLSNSEDGDAKILAGGQSLVPVLNMRLANPSMLVDINGLDELDYVRRNGEWLEIGALTRHRTVERSREVAMHAPLLSDAMRFVGHTTIRNRGTIGGSVAHADPAAEVPAVLATLNAEVVVTGRAGQRTVGVHDFFHGFFTTALRPDELLTELRIPLLPPGSSCAVEELARRHGDFAILAVFAAVTVDSGWRCTDARIALAGVAPTPIRVPEVEAALVGSELSDEVIETASRLVSADLFSISDIHGPAEYRHSVAPVLIRRALQRAASGTTTRSLS